MSLRRQKIKHFHYTHGSDIELRRRWNEARRTQSATNGLVFTSKPVQIDKKIAIRLVDVSDELPAIISIGFTSHNPSSLYGDLPASTRSELKRKPGFWICPVPKEVCTNNRVVFFYVNCNGEIKYGMDGEDKGTFDKKVDITGQLWGLIDIWSPPTGIQLCAHVTKSGMFHYFSSRNVKISGNHLYKSFQKRRTSYAFTSRPLRMKELIKIKFSDCGTFGLGLTSCDPANLKRRYLPENVESLLDRPEYWIVINDSSWYFKHNEEISYMITESGEMRIWKNNSLLLKVIHVDQTQPLWGFFALCSIRNIEVTSALSDQNEGKTVATVEVTNVSTNQMRKTIATPSAPDLEQAQVAPSSSRFQSSDGVREPEQPESTDFSDEDQSLCVVCCDVATEVALIPCGHMCMCLGCARRQWRGGGDGLCPICRNKIQNILKVYKS